MENFFQIPASYCQNVSFNLVDKIYCTLIYTHVYKCITILPKCVDKEMKYCFFCCYKGFRNANCCYIYTLTALLMSSTPQNFQSNTDRR